MLVGLCLDFKAQHYGTYLSFSGRVYSQSSITLWEFGASRLLGGSTTLPLQPLGTAGLATTYVYEVADSVVTEISGGTTEFVTLNPSMLAFDCLFQLLGTY